METSVQRSSKIPSISDSYKRITGGTPIISVGNPGASYKSQTESALEKYQAEKAVAEQRLKDRYIQQYGEAGYNRFMEANQKRLGDIESSIKQAENNKKRGMSITPAQILRDEQQRERDYRASTRGLEGTYKTSQYANSSIY
jgi:16S rRNA C967 or C1407 C5-methylase (RsmB/RsmF family)